VAAGQGTRLGDLWKDSPKALVPLLGRPMLYYSLEAFDQVREIDRISVACAPDSIGEFKKMIRVWGFSKKIMPVPGGEFRSQSVLNALKALSDAPPDIVLIHDAARPCITADMVTNLIESSKDGEAATLAHSAIDTLREVENGLISGEIDRTKIVNLETPQLFPYSEILALHEKSDPGADLPDDTTLITKAGKSVRLVFHEDSNLKVTYPEDVAAAEGILFSRGWSDVSEGED
jgi:2-C-methyl-D-erythritol 4-phosphate cytidylyltransferase/2-C-methyl-D-erythritol 2,4-cyclodiphosphate synthase